MLNSNNNKILKNKYGEIFLPSMIDYSSEIVSNSNPKDQWRQISGASIRTKFVGVFPEVPTFGPMYVSLHYYNCN